MRSTLSSDQKDRLRSNLSDIVRKRDEIIFAYLHGSFLNNRFHDIDLAFFVKDVEDVLDYELATSLEIEKQMGFPIDVKVLNSAPLSFKYEVTKGELIFCRDEDILANFIERTWHDYLDFKPFEREMLMTMLE